jgi:hypothetical protein
LWYRISHATTAHDNRGGVVRLLQHQWILVSWARSGFDRMDSLPGSKWKGLGPALRNSGNKTTGTKIANVVRGFFGSVFGSNTGMELAAA